MIRDWFEWNGVRCTDFGIHVSQQPELTIPVERASEVTIPGRSGALVVKEGDNVYDKVSLTVECFVSNLNRLEEISAWLRGTGSVRFANRPNGVYYARISNQIPFEKVIRGRENRTFVVTFTCEPFFHVDSDPIRIDTATVDRRINNDHAFPSEPIITVRLASENASAQVEIGNATILINNLPSTTVTLDCEVKMAYSSDTNLSTHISLVDDVWPTLDPGYNDVNFTSPVSVVSIDPNWRCL